MVRTVFLAAGLTLLAACGAPDLQPKSQPMALDVTASVALPASVTLSAAQWPSAAWWQRFGDAQLDRFVQRALADSPTLRLARARIDQANAMSAVAGAADEAHVDTAAGSSRQRFSAHGTTPQPVAGTWNFVTQATIGVQYELDFWGRNSKHLAAELDRQHAAEVDAAAARLILATSVVQAYIALGNIDDTIQLEQAQLQRQQAIATLVQSRQRAQLDSQVDVKQALSTIPLRRVAIATLQERRELLQHELAALQGIPAGSDFSMQPPSLRLPQQVTVPSTVPAELIGRRPDVVAQRWRVQASQHDIKVAQANFYPNINLSAFIGLQSLGFEHLDEYGNRIVGVGPALSLPLFDGGRRRAGLALQDAHYDAAVETYNSTVLAALRDVADQLSGLKWLATRLQEQRQALDTAQSTADLVRQRYRAGLGNYIQVLVAQDAVLQRRRVLQDLQSQALSLDAALSRALGGGQLDVAAPDTPALPIQQVESADHPSHAN